MIRVNVPIDCVCHDCGEDRRMYVMKREGGGLCVDLHCPDCDKTSEVTIMPEALEMTTDDADSSSSQ